MPEMPPTFHPFGDRTARAKVYETDRGSAAERGYGRRWEKSSLAYRREHPLCEYCALEGRVTATQCVDHLYPHQGDTVLFWRSEWWVSSCFECHDGFKQAIERRGKVFIDALAARLARPVMQSSHGQGG